MADKINSAKKLKKVLQDEESLEEFQEKVSNHAEKTDLKEISALNLNQNSKEGNKQENKSFKDKNSNKNNNKNVSKKSKINKTNSDDSSLKDDKEESEVRSEINKKKFKNNVGNNQKNNRDLNDSNKSEENDENNDSELDNEINKDDNFENKVNLKSKGKSANYKGKKNLHYLPLKMEYDGYAEVDRFFEPLIQKDQTKEENNYYTTSFRGRVFNGKRIQTYLDDEKANFGVVQASYKKDDKGNLYLENEINLKDFYVWKFDENLDNYNYQSLFQINKLVDDLGKLA